MAGYTATLDGAWLWDPSDTPIADVGNVEVDGGQYLALRRTRGGRRVPAEWAALALPLVAYERYRQRRGRRRTAVGTTASTTGTEPGQRSIWSRMVSMVAARRADSDRVMTGLSGRPSAMQRCTSSTW